MVMRSFSLSAHTGCWLEYRHTSGMRSFRSDRGQLNQLNGTAGPSLVVRVCRVQGNQPGPHIMSFLWTEGAGAVGTVRPAPLYRHFGVCHQVQVPIGGLVAAAK